MATVNASRTTTALRHVLTVRTGLVGEPCEIDLSDKRDFRQAVKSLAEIAETIGTDWRWTDRLRRISDNDDTFAIVHRVVRYVMGHADDPIEGILHRASVEGWGTIAEGNDEKVMEWLPFAIQLVGLIRSASVDP